MTTWRARGGGGARIKIMGNLGLRISMPMPKDVSTSSKKIIDDGYTRETIMQNDFEPMLVNIILSVDIEWSTKLRCLEGKFVSAPINQCLLFCTPNVDTCWDLARKVSRFIWGVNNGQNVSKAITCQ